MKKIVFAAVIFIFGSVVEASYGSNDKTEVSTNLLLQNPKRIMGSVKKEIILEEQFLLMKLKEEADRYRRQHFNLTFNFSQNQEKLSNLNQKNEIEEKQGFQEKLDTTALYQKLLLALNTYAGDIRLGLDEIKEALGLSSAVPTTLGALQKAVKQVKTGQKKPRWNWSGIIGNGFHLGQYGVLGYILYYLLTLKK